MAEIIVDEVLWTNSARNSFNKIVLYLERTWSEKEVSKFVKRTVEVISALKYYPEMCRPSLKRKYVRIALLNKHTQMFYHYKPGKRRIEILLFWGMKQDPKKLKY